MHNALRYTGGARGIQNKERVVKAPRHKAERLRIADQAVAPHDSGANARDIRVVGQAGYDHHPLDGVDGSGDFTGARE